jgi:hypothetical protein
MKEEMRPMMRSTPLPPKVYDVNEVNKPVDE